MNARNDMVMNEKDADQYLDKMIRNARKHGILISSITGVAPMANKSFGRIVTDNLRDAHDIRALVRDVSDLYDSVTAANRQTEKIAKAITNDRIRELLDSGLSPEEAAEILLKESIERAKNGSKTD